MTAETFVCRYCNERRPVAERSPDHVLAAALGSNLTEQDVCESCNQRADKEVDRPLVRYVWVREQRHRHQARDRYGRVPDAPQLEGETEDGDKVITILDRQGWRPYLPPTPTEEVDEKTFRVSADASEADGVLAKKFERLEKRFKGASFEVGKPESRRWRPWITHQVVLDTRMYPRAGAKVALALAPYALGDAWLDSPEAEWLRAVLWDEQDIPDVGLGQLRPVPEQLTAEGFGRFLEPPEHIITVTQTDLGPSLNILLFGEQLYGVPVGRGWEVKQSLAWRLDPAQRTVERMSYEDLLVLIALRYGDSEAA